MKKLIPLLATGLSILALAACDFDDNDDHVQTPASSTVSSSPSKSSSASSSSTSAAISEDEAKNTALADAGLTAEQVTFTKVAQDIENGKNVYELEFVKDSIEYSYTIDSGNGAILEKETDNVNDQS